MLSEKDISINFDLLPFGLTIGNWLVNSCLIATSKSLMNHSEEKVSPLVSSASLKSEKASE